MKWHIGSKPTKPGMYLVILLSPNGVYDRKTQEFIHDGTFEVEIERKYLAYIDEGSEDELLGSWAMDGEPRIGLVWTEDTGDSYGVKVYAWADSSEVKSILPELPENAFLWWEKE